MPPIKYIFMLVIEDYMFLYFYPVFEKLPLYLIRKRMRKVKIRILLKNKMSK